MDDRLRADLTCPVTLELLVDPVRVFLTVVPN
jgi:hypothetical protein